MCFLMSTARSYTIMHAKLVYFIFVILAHSLGYNYKSNLRVWRGTSKVRGTFNNIYNRIFICLCDEGTAVHGSWSKMNRTSWPSKQKGQIKLGDEKLPDGPSRIIPVKKEHLEDGIL